MVSDRVTFTATGITVRMHNLVGVSVFLPGARVFHRQLMIDQQDRFQRHHKHKWSYRFFDQPLDLCHERGVMLRFGLRVKYRLSDTVATNPALHHNAGLKPSHSPGLLAFRLGFRSGVGLEVAALGLISVSRSELLLGSARCFQMGSALRTFPFQTLFFLALCDGLDIAEHLAPQLLQNEIRRFGAERAEVIVIELGFRHRRGEFLNHLLGRKPQKRGHFRVVFWDLLLRETEETREEASYVTRRDLKH